jgi:hypothetical protein
MIQAAWHYHSVPLIFSRTQFALSLEREKSLTILTRLLAVRLLSLVPDVFPGGKGGRCVRLTTLPTSCAVVMKSGNLNFLEPSGPLQACNGSALLLLAVRLGNPSSIARRDKCLALLLSRPVVRHF